MTLSLGQIKGRGVSPVAAVWRKGGKKGGRKGKKRKCGIYLPLLFQPSLLLCFSKWQRDRKGLLSNRPIRVSKSDTSQQRHGASKEEKMKREVRDRETREIARRERER